MLPEGACLKVTMLGLKQVNDPVDLQSDLIGNMSSGCSKNVADFLTPLSASIQKRGLF